MRSEYLRWEERYWNANRGEWSTWWTNTSHAFIEDVTHDPLDVTVALRKLRERTYDRAGAIEVREWSIEHVVRDLRGLRVVRSWRR